MTKTRVLVADGMTVFRAAVVNVLAREQDFEVREAGSLRDVLRVIAADPVEIALLDLELPPSGAMPAIRALRQRLSTEVVIWSSRPDKEAVFDAIRAGASGYLHKEISPDALVRSLRGVARGEAPLSRALMALMIDALHSLEERGRARQQTSVLSEREREVLQQVAAGARNRQIADSLSISEFTVKRHVQNILRKLDVPTRREAAAFYLAAYSGATDGEALRA